MVGTLVKSRRVARGLTQAELAQRTGLRQTYISQIEKGEIAMPREHNLDALGAALGIARGEFYLAAGMLDGLSAPEREGGAPPRVVVVQGPDGVEEVPIERAVAFVERYPNPRHQARLAAWRERNDRSAYERLCARLFVAWTSNYEMFLDTLDHAGAH
jgi:transcriptional regulator with XRE-family HTH domain